MIQRDRQIGPVGVSQELGIETNHLYREGDLVLDALSRPMAAAEQFEVLDPVVGTLSVKVVNGLVGCQGASEVLLHDVPVFEHLALFPGTTDVSRQREPNIAVPLDVAIHFAGSKSFFRTSTQPFVLACAIAKTLRSVVLGATAPFQDGAFHRGGLAALFAYDRASFFGISTTPEGAAWNRAVHRVLPVGSIVDADLAVSTSERFAAPFAGKRNSFRFLRASVLRFVGTVAFMAAKFTFFAGAAGKNNTAFFAGGFHRLFLSGKSGTNRYTPTGCSSTLSAVGV
jgi:hypothetical protein